jgi:hypothetical protein
MLTEIRRVLPASRSSDELAGAQGFRVSRRDGSALTSTALSWLIA